MTKRLRIAIITPGTFPIPSPFSSSVETVVDRYTNALKKEIDFFILGKKTKDLPNVERRGALQYVRVPYKTPEGYIKKIVNELSHVDVDIIHVENRPKFLPLLQKTFPRIPLLLSLHSTKFISDSHIATEELMHSLSIADNIMVNSQFLKDVIVEKSVCCAEKISVNHLGVDTNQFKSKWSDRQMYIGDLKKQLGIESTNVLLFVGRLKKMKGVHLLLKAFPAILAQEPDTQLIIVGNASYRSSQQTQYTKLLHQKAAAISQQVRFVPFVAHDQIQNWYTCADISLVPSIGREAFGLVNVEAMATGVPVIASNIGGISEIIRHGQTGFLVNPSAIETEMTKYVLRLLKNQELLKQMGERSVLHVENYFTWEEFANRLQQLYYEISPK